MPNAPWRPFPSEQVLSLHQPGFAWLARMQVAPLLSARILDCYVMAKGCSKREVSKGELMRYLEHLIWAPYAIRYNPQLSRGSVDANTVEVSAAHANGEARVRLIFKEGDIAASRPTIARVREDVAWCR